MAIAKQRTSDTGFWVEDNIFSASECDSLLQALTHMGLKRGRAGARHLMSHPAIAALAADARLLNIARQALGAHAVPYRATLFEKSGHANWLVVWHQDTALPLASRFGAPDWGPWSTKAGIIYAHAPTQALARVLALRIHLDASTSENGPLRVIAGSHVCGVMTDEQVFTYASAHASVECLVPRGGVLAMRPLLIHSSSKARTAAARRVLHIEYADSLALGLGIRLAIA